jgi:predicted small metal-binding protein
MSKIVHCRDIGFDCEGVVRAETEEEVMKLVAEHAQTVHHLDEISDEITTIVRKVMRDE